MARRRLGLWRRLAVLLLLPGMQVWTKRSWSGMENLPAAGGFIITPNHMSQFDPLLVAHYVYASGRWPRFLAKASIWKVPFVGFMLRKTMQIPVERGSVEAVKSLDTLIEALHQGGVVVIYPEGTTTREPDLWPMRGKTGAARLALVTGAPVLPMATWGAQRVHDVRTKKFTVGRGRVPVSVSVGKPVDLSRWAGQAPSRAVLEQMTEAIQLATRDLLAELRDETPPPIYQHDAGRAKGPTGPTA
ncbi:lysophospholipid acyltransferase family protein [Amorphoplanes digitatis]|uniref:1-acyl-sn-glycerol-3-phosphate acyltransferase n=1 Tax=Actinoplanes digitatis TaxID=1868 RepID=A0A7W7HT82_9ACTN|nr:lysophospholipid acyltransferase family protein [Actinoplanes digitatis]MBB4760304.1 1-acyl-sn-glycerol-3-phosphate acyltransferase [Actinoplanes digitatis]GID97513.1 1-acyl-sn-glycerol-3-phosphate acyltransferase [Actinoplanes digitatis]